MPHVEDEALKAGDEELAVQLAWERGIMDLQLQGVRDGTVFRGAKYEEYAAFYGFTAASREYSLRRAAETGNVVLRAQHLLYARSTIPQTGREWVDLTRRLVTTLREHAELVLSRLKPGADGIEACPLVDGLEVLLHLGTIPGILRAEELEELGQWLVSVASRLRDQQWSEDDYNRPHRWPFEVLQHLVNVPADLVSAADREKALRLVNEAYEFFVAEPLASTLTNAVTEVDHRLRKHFGEGDTHRLMVRRSVDAFIRQAMFFVEHGSFLVAASMYREGVKLAHQHAQYFEATELAEIKTGEQGAINSAVGRGEFKRVPAGRIDLSAMDFTGSNAAETVARLKDSALQWLPDAVAVRSAVEKEAIDSPLQSLIPAARIDGEKVVGEALTPEELLESAATDRTAMLGQLVGAVVARCLTRSAQDQGLRADQVMVVLADLPLTDGTVPVLQRGIERLLTGDTISATYILAPISEEAIRRVLREQGLDTTTYRKLDQATGSSRTDDATLGDLLRSKHADGRSVADIVGTDLFELIRAVLAVQRGPNLRNRVGHGQAGTRECTGPNAGLLLFLLVCLARTQAGA